MPTLTVSCNDERSIVNPAYGGLGASFSGGEFAASDNTRFDSTDVLNTLNEEYDYIGGGFDLSSLPDGAVINGLTLTIERRRQNGTAVLQDALTQFSINGSTFVGDNKALAQNWPTTDEQIVYGGPTDLWGRTWTTAELKGATFGAYQTAKVVTAGTATSVQWDWFQLSIRYNESGDGGSDGSVNGSAGQSAEHMDKFIDETLTFYAQFNDATLAATDATGSPAYRVYEESTGTAILTGSMTILDSSNTDGFYYGQLTLSAANGFEVGKDYVVRVSATVSAVAQAGIAARFTMRTNYWAALPAEITGRATTMQNALFQLWQRFFNKMTVNRDTGVATLYQTDESTTILTGTNSTSSSTETRGEMN